MKLARGIGYTKPFWVAVTFALVAASCSSADVALDTEPSATAVAVATATPIPEPTPAPTAAALPTATPQPVPTVASAPEWEQVAPPDDCHCSDGSGWTFWVRDASVANEATDVVFFLDGGGACWNDWTCDPDGGTYQGRVDASDDPRGARGIFDLDNPENPVRDWSFVTVPYCTGDVHLGTRSHGYRDGDLRISHLGRTNAQHAIDSVRRFPNVERILVVGASAGAVATPLYAGLLADRYPNAEIIALADSSGAYPDKVAREPTAERWGIADGLPTWADATDEFTIPKLFTWAGRQHPDIRFARYDTEADAVQRGFVAISGLQLEAAADLREQIQITEADIEDDIGPVASWLAPGDSHTIVGTNAFYAATGDGVRFVDWVQALVDGDEVGDIDATDD